ncbi:MAG: hypothetical protein ACMUEM_06500 [Flavobacteriales bacterium AspAUS03]
MYDLSNTDECDMFRHLITFSDVGLVAAILILSSIGLGGVGQGVLENQSESLKYLKDVDIPRPLQWILIELKDKIL